MAEEVPEGLKPGQTMRVRLKDDEDPTCFNIGPQMVKHWFKNGFPIVH